MDDPQQYRIPQLSADDESRPRSIAVAAHSDTRRRRAAFSFSVAGITSNHVKAPQQNHLGRERHRRKTDDDSLRLIDDLTNRSLDPMFSDAQLSHQSRSVATIWLTKAIVFIMCIGVGFAGSLFVQQLHSDPRKELRNVLISELTGYNEQVETLSKETSSLRRKIDKQSSKLGNGSQGTNTNDDDMMNGSSALTGEGITLTLANPLAAGSENGSSIRDEQSNQIRVITDTDLQQIISLMWQSGAEAIAVNGNRIGVQTSVRTAGHTILIGVNQVQSPYKIEAIGDKTALAQTLEKKSQPTLYDAFEAAGIYPQLDKASSLTLQAADSGDVSFAKRSK